MNNHIPPENFGATLDKAMEAVGPFSDIIRPIGLASECHHMRRGKQIKLGETPLDHVPLEIAIATLRQLEAILVNTRATLEKIEIEKRRMNGATIRLVSGSTTKNTGAERG